MKGPRISLSTLILLSLGSGILVGIFFGESVGFLSVVGDAFIKLLQMTVLPYVTVALIAGLGSLDYRSAGAIFKYGGLAVLTLWLLTVIMIVVMPLAFPDWETATFFSTSLVENRQSVDILALYIPANPFFSLANNIVPAVVLFSIALGIALMGVPGKEGFLENIKVLAAGLTGITNFVIRLTPIGVFAIAAAASGTLQPEALEMLQVYGAIYVLTALVLAFWALPALVTSIMPLGYRDVIVGTRDILLTAFATGSVFVVLPLLAERAKQVLGGMVSEERRESSDSLVDVVVPTAFSFPSVGTVLILSFVLFAGWLAGTPVALSQYPVFIVSGVLSVFGGVYVGIPFILDMMRIPSDTFNLLVMFNQVVSGRFGAMLAAMSILTITLLCAGAVGGRLKVSLRGFIRYVAVTVVLMTVSVTGVRVFFNHAVAHEYAGYKMFIDLELEGPFVPTTVQKDTMKSFPPADPGETAVERIRRRGKIRVGYLRDLLPWAFINSASHLVGFDVQMAHTLARDLGVEAEFVRLEPDQMTGCLDSGYCDIIMSGIAITTERAEKMSFSTSYMDQTMAFIVEDARREEFNSREAVQRLRELRIGMPDVPYLMRMVQNYLPDATIIPLATAREFFRDESHDLDALVYSAEGGSAWCLIYPRYTVAIPHPDVAAVPLAYPIARGENEMLELVNTWVELKKRDGTIRRAYDHWILGKGAQKSGPRWCVIRDVLHWVD